MRSGAVPPGGQGAGGRPPARGEGEERRCRSPTRHGLTCPPATPVASVTSQARGHTHDLTSTAQRRLSVPTSGQPPGSRPKRPQERRSRLTSCSSRAERPTSRVLRSPEALCLCPSPSLSRPHHRWWSPWSLGGHRLGCPAPGAGGACAGPLGRAGPGSRGRTCRVGPGSRCCAVGLLEQGPPDSNALVWKSRNTGRIFTVSTTDTFVERRPIVPP